VQGQLGHELAVQRVVAMGAGADAALGLLDDVAQGPALQEAGVDAGDAVGDGVEQLLGSLPPSGAVSSSSNTRTGSRAMLRAMSCVVGLPLERARSSAVALSRKAGRRDVGTAEGRRILNIRVVGIKTKHGFHKFSALNSNRASRLLPVTYACPVGLGPESVTHFAPAVRVWAGREGASAELQAVGKGQGFEVGPVDLIGVMCSSSARVASCLSSKLSRARASFRKGA
jgi:hypothetical protein